MTAAVTSISERAIAGMSLPPDAPASAWAARISARWRESFEAIIQVGQLLMEAKAALPHGDFGKMIDADLPFTASTANRLMAIASDPKITNPAHVQHLPPHWGTLYELTKLPEEKFKERIHDGTIRPDMERRDIATEVKREQRMERETTLATKQRALPEKKYGVIYGDPAWRFGPYSRMTGLDRAPDNHYPTMTLPQIMRLGVKEIAANDCALFLWTTGAMLIEALYVAEAWGFLDLGDRAERAALMTRDDIDWTRFQVGDPNARYKSQQVWKKVYSGEMLGTGYWFRNEHETLMLFTRGNVPAPAPGTQFRSVIEASVGEHSAKPEAFLEMIEQYFPTLPKIELNRRGPARPGWDVWGNEAESHA